MVDWATASIKPRLAMNEGLKLFDTGRFQEINPDGEVLKTFASRMFHNGSHDSRISFRAPVPCQLEMSGNPAKYFQGHNLFGSGDYLGLFLSTGLAARMQGAQFPSPATYLNNDMGEPHFTRIDLTRSYRFDTNEQARAWLRLAGATGRSKSGKAIMSKETVYYGKNSTRWSLKMYQKFDEIHAKGKGHAISDKLKREEIKQLVEWSEGIVRFELTLRRPEIEKLPKDFDNLEVFNDYFSRIQLNNNSEVLDMDVLKNPKLKPFQKALLNSWALGADVREFYNGEKSFYKVRREILNSFGIDIASPFVKTDEPLLVTALEIDRWDPQPIETLIFHPDEKIKDSYGLK